jgi:phosphatidylethanolamine-binding protein (PEBP) family uncharacterized protein
MPTHLRPSSRLSFTLALATSLGAWGCGGETTNGSTPAATTTGPAGSTAVSPGPTTSSPLATTTSPVGPTGPTGGPTGPTGGPTGPTGGPTGPTGGPTGPTGSTAGPTGPTGGPTGPTGSTGSVSTDTATSSDTSASAGAPTSEGETSAPANGEFTLLGPWTAKDTCTKEARDTCDNIPVENRWSMIQGTPKGGDVMPTITWTEGPEGTTGYALIFQDLAFPTNDKPSVHWAIWNIPADVLSIGPEVPAGATENAWVGNGWMGSGSCCNVYELVVYALKGEFSPADRNAARDALEANAGQVVLARDYARVAPLDECTPTMPCQ